MDLSDTGSELRRTTTRPGRTRTTIHAIESPYGFVGLPQARDAAVDTGDDAPTARTPSYARDRYVRQREHLSVAA